MRIWAFAEREKTEHQLPDVITCLRNGLKRWVAQLGLCDKYHETLIFACAIPMAEGMSPNRVNLEEFTTASNDQMMLQQSYVGPMTVKAFSKPAYMKLVHPNQTGSRKNPGKTRLSSGDLSHLPPGGLAARGAVPETEPTAWKG